MPTYNTKWFQNSMAGAPVLSGQAGALLSVLNACLVDGFNLLTLDSLVVAGNVATGTKNAHGYLHYQIIEINNATPASLNGQWRVTGVTANTFTFTTSGISDQTATGTITAKTPGCGWEKLFTGTNVVVYRSTSASASGSHAVRVTDTGTTTATCLAAEDWTDVSSPVNSIDTFYLPKSSTADSTARGWNIIADDRTVYVATSFAGGRRDVHTWGDFNSFLSGDGHAFCVRAPQSASVANLGHQATLGHAIPDQGYAAQYSYASRAYTQVVGAVPLRQASMAGALHDISVDVSSATLSDATQNKQFRFSGNCGYSAAAGVVTYSTYQYQGPSPVDGGIHFVPVFLIENPLTSTMRVRGSARGLLHIVETTPLINDVAPLDGIEGVDEGLVLGIRTQCEMFGYSAGSRLFPESHIGIDLGNWS